MAKQRLKMHISPAGKASYPYLTRYDDKFVAEGEYSVKLILDADENKDFLEGLQEQAQNQYDETIKELKSKKKVKQAKELNVHVPFTEEYDDEGEETGNVVLNFKLKREVTTKEGKKFTQKPDVFDAKKKPMGEDAKIGSGSTIKVAFNVIPFYNAATSSAGVSLRLKAAQIIELVEFGGGDADSYGFGEEEGFEAEEETSTAAAFDEDDDEDEGDDDF